MATATSLTRQNPTARRRWAWCRPATGANTWSRSPAATASTAAMVAPATSRAEGEQVAVVHDLGRPQQRHAGGEPAGLERVVGAEVVGGQPLVGGDRAGAA